MKRKINIPNENRPDASLLQVERTATRPYLQRIRIEVLLLALLPLLVQVKAFLFSKSLFLTNPEQF